MATIESDKFKDKRQGLNSLLQFKLEDQQYKNRAGFNIIGTTFIRYKLIKQRAQNF